MKETRAEFTIETNQRIEKTLRHVSIWLITKENALHLFDKYKQVRGDTCVCWRVHTRVVHERTRTLRSNSESLESPEAVFPREGSILLLG